MRTLVVVLALLSAGCLERHSYQHVGEPVAPAADVSDSGSSGAADAGAPGAGDGGDEGAGDG